MESSFPHQKKGKRRAGSQAENRAEQNEQSQVKQTAGQVEPVRDPNQLSHEHSLNFFFKTCFGNPKQ